MVAAHESASSPLHHYARLALMLVISFLAMFALMYAMVDRAANALPNVNQAYMAGLMTGAMALIEIAFMASMYPSKAANLAIGLGGLVLAVACWCAIREQAGVRDEQFLRSMIPHHAAAILMCREASIDRADVRRLCEGIVASQSGEIGQMKQMLQVDDTRGER